MVGRKKANATSAQNKTLLKNRRKWAAAGAAAARTLGKARRKNLPPAAQARREVLSHTNRLTLARKQKLPSKTLNEIQEQISRARVRKAKAMALEQDANVRSVIKFGSNMKKFFQNPDFSDITFLVHGQEVFAHKNILAAQCEYFNVLFKPKSPFAESGCSEIEVREWSHNAFVAVLEWLYTCHTPTDQSPQNIREVATIADFYNLPELKAVCGAILKRLYNQCRSRYV